MKAEASQKVLIAIRRILDGKIYVSEQLASDLIDWLIGGGADERRGPIQRLSDREFEVFQFIGQGLGSRQIADQLHVSIKTVQSHRESIKEKLSVDSANDLIQYAIRWYQAQNSE